MVMARVTRKTTVAMRGRATGEEEIRKAGETKNVVKSEPVEETGGFTQCTNQETQRGAYGQIRQARKRRARNT